MKDRREKKGGGRKTVAIAGNGEMEEGERGKQKGGTFHG